MISLVDLLMLTLIVLVIFLIIGAYNLIMVLKETKKLLKDNTKLVNNILTDVAYLTNETTTLEEKIKGHLMDFVSGLLVGKGKDKE